MWDAILQDLRNSFQEPHIAVVLMRLVVAAILGAIVGVDRELRSRVSGMRTYTLISLGSCLFALVTYDLLEYTGRHFQGASGDPLRLISAVTSGVAFLGAGSIIVAGGRVQGLTTGATMWMAGAIGLACGIGQVALAATATALLALVLYLFGRLEGHLGAPPLLNDIAPQGTRGRRNPRPFYQPNQDKGD